MATEFGENEVVHDDYEPCGQPPEDDKKQHWIEIELYYEDTGEPVPGEEYCVTIPEGVERRGHLDAKGFAREDGIENSGNCKIEFPKLDKHFWEPG
jgi:hypothetical protein